MNNISTVSVDRLVIGPIPGLPPNPNVKRHWTRVAKDNKAWGALVYGFAYNTRPVKPLPKAHLHYHISVGDERAHDADNIIASLKPCQDALKGLIIVDDSISNISTSYSYDRLKPRSFVITVTEENTVVKCDILCEHCADWRVQKNAPE